MQKQPNSDLQSDSLPEKKQTTNLIRLLENNRKHLLTLWVEKVREEFNASESTSDDQLSDHMLFIIDAIISELRGFENDSNKSKSVQQGDMQYDDGIIEDKKDGGELHGRQRAGINAYNADKVYWEYVLLRKIIVEFAQHHRELDIDHLEVITCVIESCSRESLQTFAKTVQNVQSKILSSIVHDIRNPLNTISMMGELIAMGVGKAKSSLFAEKIVKSTSRIGSMLDDMLLTLSAEGGQGLDLVFDEHNINYFLSAVVLEAQTIHGNRLKLNLPENNLLAVFDEALLKRVFENLITNAFKYGDDVSDVTITVTETPQQIAIDVHNFGQPINKALWEDVFVYLKRFEGQKNTEHRSWGIGLAYVKAVVNGHGGKVILSSDTPLGTRFLVELPKGVIYKGQTITVSM